jgi:hypothetical protein
MIRKFFFAFLFEDLLKVFWWWVDFFTTSLIPLFLLSTAKIECSFTYGLYMYCCFRTIVSTIIYIDSSLTNDLLHACSYKTRYNLSPHMFFGYYFTIKLTCSGFEPSCIWLYEAFNFILIFSCKNFPSLRPIHSHAHYPFQGTFSTSSNDACFFQFY